MFFSVAALDCRGQDGQFEDVGGIEGNTLHGYIIRGLSGAFAGFSQKLLFRQLFLDTAQLVKIVVDLPAVDCNRVVAMGGGQGGALTVTSADLEPPLNELPQSILS